MISRQEIEAAATAIANNRGARRGAAAVDNILEVLERLADGKLYREVMEDAQAALEAAGRARLSSGPSEAEIYAVISAYDRQVLGRDPAANHDGMVAALKALLMQRTTSEPPVRIAPESRKGS